MEQLNYEIAGEKYFLIKKAVEDSASERSLLENVKKYDCIIQSQGIIRKARFLESAILEYSILVPETSVKSFTRET
jgi:hypothetical protein